jgi:hypothetical protein
VDWRENYAYTLGEQAYVFGFPYVYLPSIRWSWVTVPKADRGPRSLPSTHRGGVYCERRIQD